MSDVFTLYGPSEPPPERKQPYIAYGLVKHTKALVRIDICRQDGTVFAIDDANLHDVVSTDEDFCSLIYDKCIVQLRGSNIAPLIDLLKYYEIRFVECFDPEIHAMPADHEPLIDRIQCRAVLLTEDSYLLPESYQTDIPLVRME